jgi:glutathione synthase/RimK-type ligase-like ATP-grasp enzyme
VRVAVATCASEVDADSEFLLRALEDVGVEAELVVWNDEGVSWDDYALTVVRSTWDYTSQREAFLAWARSLAHVANPYEVLDYSSDKRYLFDLAARGHRVVPTRLVAVGEVPTFYDVDFVVKPSVGAGSIDADRFAPD